MLLDGMLRRGTLLSVAVLVVCVLGIVAAMRVPVQMIPDLEVRTITVQTRWPGATPQDVEKEILVEQETYLRSIRGLKRMVTTASTGEALIELEFPFGTDINATLIQVSNALSRVSGYPENVDEPRLFTTSFSDSPFMFFRIAPLPGNPAGLDLNLMRDFLDDYVRVRMERVPGISEALIREGAVRQVQVLVDPERLAERGISLSQLRAAIRARNRDISAGDIDSGKRRYLVRTIGRFDDLDDLGQMIVARPGDGERRDALVRVTDVAEVRLWHSEVRNRAFVNGEPVINMAVRRESGSNVIDIKRAMMPLIDELNREVLEPAGLVMSLTSDDVRYVEASIANVRQNLMIGAVLATGLMFLFLRSVPATLVVLLGVPVCIIAAFIGLLAVGRTINVISLAGIAFAIGMTLDNSIVVLESIERARRRGLEAFQAAAEGLRQVWPAVLASTLTTILVFAPVLFIAEEAGQLYSDVAVAISAAILASMLVAVTAVPAASSRLLARHTASGEPLAGPLKRRFMAFVHAITNSAPRRWATMGGIVLLTATAGIALTPPAEYLPEGEEAKTFVRLSAPAGYSLGEMTGVAEGFHEAFTPYIGDDPRRYDRGESPVPAIEYLNVQVQAQNLRVIAESRDPRHIDDLALILSAHFNDLPAMRPFASRGSIISSNDGGTRSINVDVTGTDLRQIYAAAAQVADRARTLFDNPQVRSDPSSLVLGQPLLELRPRWERAAELGFSTEELGYAIAALTDGAYVDEVFVDDDKLDLFLYSRGGSPTGIDEIARFGIYAPAGLVVPVGTVADVVETVDTDNIRRVDGRRTVTLYIIPPRSVPLETAAARVESELVGAMNREGALPPGVTLKLSGASDALSATRDALLENFLVAVVLCYLLLVAIFSHWGYPLLIMATVPLGIAGGIIGLCLLNVGGGLLPLLGMAAISQPFDMITMLGFLILVGTVVNNPILIVHGALARIAEAGSTPVQAVRDAVDSRLRPILMTTATTIFGLAPLVFIPGEGTELYRGLGAIVLFGLLFSAFITLMFLPALLVTVLGMAERWADRRHLPRS
jgi:multidrug efflux pump subunit AcrB